MKAIKTKIIEQLQQSLHTMDIDVPAEKLLLERPKDKKFGHFSSNIAMQLARTLKKNPMQIAEAISEQLKFKKNEIKEIDIVKPGFINFHLHPYALLDTLSEIFLEQDDYGRCNIGNFDPALVEFVSANPTGPLNVVNARAATIGDSLVKILRFCGYQAQSENYVNDAGKQVDLLTESVEARYYELLGEKAEIPEGGYQGEYIRDIAVELKQKFDNSLKYDNVSERHYQIREFTLTKIMLGQQRDLIDFGVIFDNWTAESNIRSDGAIQEVLTLLTENGFAYEKEEAVWFAGTKMGLEKDFVLLKSNGEPAYILPDIAYHINKFSRNYKLLIDVLGPDHHGYLSRMEVAMKSLNYPIDQLRFLIVQQVNLLSKGKQVKMSKRKGELIPMRSLIEEIGKDAGRFFFLMRKTNSHLDFDLDLAMKKSDENPVFYVQYAHARIHSILRKYMEENNVNEIPFQEVDLKALKNEDELDLIEMLSRFPEIVLGAAENLEPHRLTGYLTDLASTFHRFYHNTPVLSKSERMTLARLALIDCTRQVLNNAANLIGISMPEKM